MNREWPLLSYSGYGKKSRECGASRLKPFWVDGGSKLIVGGGDGDGASGLADNQFRSDTLVGNAPLALFLRGVDRFHDDVDREVPHGPERLADSSQRSRGKGGKRGVVEAGDGAVFRHFQSGVGQCTDGTQRRQVVE